MERLRSIERAVLRRRQRRDRLRSLLFRVVRWLLGYSPAPREQRPWTRGL